MLLNVLLRAARTHRRAASCRAMRLRPGQRRGWNWLQYPQAGLTWKISEAEMTRPWPCRASPMI